VNVYLIRHMATADNEAGVWMGRGIDLPILSSQIPAFHERIKRIFPRGAEGKVVIYCGPARRTRMTAVELVKVLNLEAEVGVVDEFNEDEVGGWEGKSIAETREENPEDFVRWQCDPQNFRFPEGESFVEIQGRVFLKLTELAEIEMESGTSNMFVVTHGDPIRLSICQVIEASINSKNDFLLDNGSVTKLEFDGERFVVKELNYL
jgi:alpha-ribazole phosphatase